MYVCMQCSSNCVVWHYLLIGYCYVFIFLKTFKYEFVDCKHSKNKYVFNFKNYNYNYKLFIVSTILCATVQTNNTYTTIITTITTRSLFLSAYNLFASNTCSLFFSHNYLLFSHNLFVSTNTYSLDLYSEELEPRTTTVLFTRNASSYKIDWITTDWLPALSCPFIVQHEQSKERFWSRRFSFSPSRELYRDRLYIYLLILIYPFFPHACCYWFTWIVFDVFVSLYFVHVACCVFAYVYLMLILLVVYL